MEWSAALQRQPQSRLATGSLDNGGMLENKGGPGSKVRVHYSYSWSIWRAQFQQVVLARRATPGSMEEVSWEEPVQCNKTPSRATKTDSHARDS